MSCIDVFNGDADGLCALHQFRLAHPSPSSLVTGLKRDTELLRHVVAKKGDQVQVFDLSMERNHADLQRLLADGARVTYFDHHYPGVIPEHPALQAHIDQTPTTCTSLIVNRVLQGRHRLWAAVGAFGDNFFDSARALLVDEGLSEADMRRLEELGTCLNYNGYGNTLEDLWFDPKALYLRLRPYANPLAFIDEDSAFEQLRRGYQEDLALAEGLVPQVENAAVAVYLMPDAAWARRVNGVFGNLLVRRYPARAHAVVTAAPKGYRVSVRAPLDNRTGADTLCRRFPTGGGRSAAAGINHLPLDQLDSFVAEFTRFYTQNKKES